MAITPGKGTLLQYGLGNPTVYTTVGQLTRVKAFGITNPEMEITVLTDSVRKYNNSFPDGGSIEYEGRWDPANTMQTKLVTDIKLGTYDQAAATQELFGLWKIVCTDPGAADMTFQGISTRFELGDAVVDNHVTFSGTIKVNGHVTVTP